MFSYPSRYHTQLSLNYKKLFFYNCNKYFILEEVAAILAISIVAHTKYQYVIIQQVNLLFHFRCPYSAMKKTSNQLDTILQELTEYFSNIPSISIIPGDTTPPDQYTVIYEIIGVCKKDNEEVYNCNTHKVAISLPFGFPHFPPNCLPESPTFHPDFDSSAICIGEIWESDNSLITLILHIGKMITGEIYSESNAFNEEAAKWYQNNTDQIPFDKPKLSQLAQEETPEVQADEPLDNIDTLDDDDFGGSFSLERETPPTTQIDIEQFNLKVELKQFQALLRELESIPDDFEGREKFTQQIQTAMDQAMALYQEADILEHQGKPKEAMEKYLAVENLVSDFPMLMEAKERVHQASELLGDWVDGGTNDQDLEAIADIKAPVSEKNTHQAEKRTFFEDKKAVSKKLFLFALGGGTLALGATLVLTYFSLGSSLDKAGERYGECQELLNTNNFREAERKCTEALNLTADVQMVKQNEKETLTKKIQTLLTSPKLRQGLAGNTLVDGKYVSKSTKTQLLNFKEARKEGDSFFNKMLWSEAVSRYEKALYIAKSTDSIDAPLLAEIHQKLPRAKFNNFIQIGEKALSSSDWDIASEQFGKALKLAKDNPNMLPEDITRLESLSNQTKFNSLRSQGHDFFTASKWDNALSSYNQALELASNVVQATPENITNLQENIAKTTIYMTIEKGKKAFAASQWDDVIIHYEKAILLLEENSKLLSKINTEESRIKLSRIMLHAEIIKNKQDLAKYLKSKDYQAVLEKLEKIEQAITRSQFSNQPEFKTILEEMATQTKDAETQLLLIKQHTYLTDNYKKLFLKHYPAATRSALSAPAVEYLRKINGNLLFRMQCTETSGGRPLRLQMDYLYSSASKKWSFYSEE